MSIISGRSCTAIMKSIYSLMQLISAGWMQNTDYSLIQFQDCFCIGHLRGRRVCHKASLGTVLCRLQSIPLQSPNINSQCPWKRSSRYTSRSVIPKRALERRVLPASSVGCEQHRHRIAAPAPGRGAWSGGTATSWSSSPSPETCPGRRPAGHLCPEIWRARRLGPR